LCLRRKESDELSLVDCHSRIGSALPPHNSRRTLLSSSLPAKAAGIGRRATLGGLSLRLCNRHRRLAVLLQLTPIHHPPAPASERRVRPALLSLPNGRVDGMGTLLEREANFRGGVGDCELGKTFVQVVAWLIESCAVHCVNK
jgi:hypothetical protein